MREATIFYTDLYDHGGCLVVDVPEDATDEDISRILTNRVGRDWCYADWSFGPMENKAVTK